MGCLSHRRKNVELRTEQKWDYINLADFKAKGCGTGFAYAYLWFSLFLSIAVYAVDSFTAVNLLARNEFSGIQPAIDINISKWIFSACIIASFVNLGFEGLRAFRVIRRGYIAECFLDNLAVRWESIRPGSGQGWRRFLVFAELTKSKKGAEYIAIFTYFSFQSWIRVLICSGPRQVINFFTLRGLVEAKLLTELDKENSVEGSFMRFFDNFRVMYESDTRQAVLLSGMLFTLVIWVFSLLFLVAAILFYVLFLWHWIPRADGGLTGYCERKVNKSLLKIVAVKVNKALAKEQEGRRKAEYKAARKNGEKFAPLERSATLPTIPDVGIPAGGSDKLPEMPMMLARNDTMTTLPAYTSRPGTPGSSFELSSMDQKRPVPPTRTATQSTAASYSSKAPLLGAASNMGFAGSPLSPTPSAPSVDLGAYPPAWPGTSNSTTRTNGQRPPMGHMASGSSSSVAYGSAYGDSPSAEMPPFPAPVRSPTVQSQGSYSRPFPRDVQDARPPPAARRANGSLGGQSDGRSSPAPSVYSTRSAASSARGPANLSSPMYPPGRSATNPLPPRGPAYPPQRNMTGPIPPRQQPYQSEDYPPRPPTAQSQRTIAGPVGPQRQPTLPTTSEDYFSRPPTAQSQRGPHPARQTPAPADDYYRPPTAQSIRSPVRGPAPGSAFDYDVEGQRERRY